MKMGIFVIGMLSVVLVALGKQPDKPNNSNKAGQRADIGLVASNALVEVKAVLAQVPPGDTVLEIRIINPQRMDVVVCDGDPSSGCRLVYHKIKGQWVAGIMAHWTRPSPPLRRSLPNNPLGK